MCYRTPTTGRKLRNDHKPVNARDTAFCFLSHAAFHREGMSQRIERGFAYSVSDDPAKWAEGARLALGLARDCNAWRLP